MIPKVLAYIIRHNGKEKDVLVFNRENEIDAQPEVPGGTIEEDEDPENAVRREVEEEIGILEIEIIRKIATASFFADWRNEWQERNVYIVKVNAELPEKWEHIIQAGMEDKGRKVIIYWLPIDLAKDRLRWDQGQWLADV
jgi:ADP-ribose pyrophosphatase YjhB (NUDIX family)